MVCYRRCACLRVCERGSSSFPSEITAMINAELVPDRSTSSLKTRSALNTCVDKRQHRLHTRHGKLHPCCTLRHNTRLSSLKTIVLPVRSRPCVTAGGGELWLHGAAEQKQQNLHSVLQNSRAGHANPVSTRPASMAKTASTCRPGARKSLATET